MQTMSSISLQDVISRYPNGAYIPGRACYYFIDYDGELGFFVELSNGRFEDDVTYVNFDTVDEEERRKCRFIKAYIDC